MDLGLRKYYDDMTQRINDGEVDDLLRRYHEQRVREFQHERVVHLYVTLFFGSLMILFAGTLLWSLSLGVPVLSVLVGLLFLILFFTELFYIYHYYRLENGVQRLYKLTAQLYEH